MTSTAIPFTTPERIALTPPPDLTVSAWARRYRQMSPMSSPRAGAWDPNFAPAVNDIMDARSDPKCRMAVPVMPGQSGKSEGMLNSIAWTADTRSDPQLILLSTDDTRTYVMQARLIPMFERTGRLTRLMTGKHRDETQKVLQLRHTVIYTATSNSPSDVASKPCGCLYADEVDRYKPILTSREGTSALQLAFERLEAWGRESFAYVTSTPTTREGLIWRYLENSDFRQYHVACPNCRGRFVPAFEQVRPVGVKSWGDVDRLDDIVERNLAGHFCPLCGEAIHDGERAAMISGGVWAPRGCKVRDDGEVLGALDAATRGWNAEALVCTNGTPARMAKSFMEGRQEHGGLQRFVNMRRAQVWEEKLENPEVERIHQLRLPYAPGKVHSDIAFLTAGVDVQKFGFYFVVRGWGPGGRSYLVANAYVESWAGVLRAIVRMRYQSTDGARQFQVAKCLVDSSEGVRTDEIYRVCREYSDVLGAAKGAQQLTGYMVKTVTLRASKTETGEGMPLTHVNTTWVKDSMARDIGNGTFFVHDAVDQVYVQQVCSEHKIKKLTPAGEKGIWVKKGPKVQNHYLDCEVLGRAAAEMVGLAELDDGPASAFEAEAERKAPPPQSPGRANDDDDWIGRTPDNWLDEYERNW